MGTSLAAPPPPVDYQVPLRDPEGPGSDAAHLLALQRAAFAAAGAPDAAARRANLTKLERLVLDNQAEFTQAIAADFGNRSATETQLGEFIPTLNAIRYARKHVAGWMRPERRHVPITFQPASAWVQYQPLGVVGIIAPWNYPLYLSLGPLVDVLAAGNRALIKPSEFTPRFSALLARLIARSFAADEVAVITGGPDVAAAFSALPFDHLLFTGSTAIGRRVAQAAAANLTPVTLELGGKSPTILCPDYKLAQAARTIAFGKFFNAGQTCIAPDYVLAPAATVRDLALAIMNEARAFYPRIADNLDYTSIISDRHYARLVAALDAARAGGAEIMTHADADAETFRKLGPTVVLSPPADGVLMREEIFGPILPIIPYETIDDAIAFVNAGDRPLALYCLTHDQGLRDRVLSRTISGGVTLNGVMMHVTQDALPFGGVGPSGLGAYHGHEGFRRFSHARSVFKVGFMNGFEMARPPYGRFARLLARQLIGR
jgi:coniferyl-aldehyde dehydrogenase